MLDINKTIDAFRRGALDLDCKRMVLVRHKEGDERFEGQGYIRQLDDGTLYFKIYVIQHNAKPFSLLGAGLDTNDMLFDLDATAHDGTLWTAVRIVPVSDWDATDLTVLVQGQMRSMTAHLDLPQKQSCLRLHFFEEYDVPLHAFSPTEKYGNPYMTRDRAEFEACGSKFEVLKRDGSGDTVVAVTSEAAFPVAFNLRIQEALQYITAKTAFWRARVENEGNELHLELASPWRKSDRTQFTPPISPASISFYEQGWKLFGKYLSYVVAKTEGMYWNSVAYHLYNACEATANSLDARAVGVSVAVEAIVSLIEVDGDEQKSERLTSFQTRACKWLEEQSDLADLADRVKGQITSMSKPRPEDTLYALAESGHVGKTYIKLGGHYATDTFTRLLKI
jgi:hypothetical protein